MSAPTPSPTPLPPPSLTQAYIAAAVAAIVSLCLTQKFITDATAQLITGIASIAIPLVIVGIHAIVQASAHSAHVGAQSAREVADLAPAVTPVVYVSPECVLRIEAAEGQVRRELLEILAAVKPPDEPPAVAATVSPSPTAPSGNAAVTWNVPPANTTGGVATLPGTNIPM